MSNKKQSSVEWLVSQLFNSGVDTTRFIKEIQQAKAMHNEEIVKLYNDYQDYLDEEFRNQCGGQGNILTFDQWYIKTFGGSND